MTEYWKSQARKYCEFCKCWLTDNKVSVSFHEGGKKHKENVQRHIAQVTKQSAKDYKQKEKMDDEIKKMEAAAMAAYLKDVENNADLTSKNINDMLGKDDEIAAPSPAATSPTIPVPVWHEARSEKGNYYWNTVTNETAWQAPDNYLSLAQQEERELKKKEKEEKKKDKEIKKKENIKKKKEKAMFKEIYGQVSRATTAPAAVVGPAPRAAPFGSWTPVVEPEKVDFQLPKVAKAAPAPAAAPGEPEEREERPRERTVASLGDGPVEFKRRKLNKGNMRRRADDD